MAEHRRLASSRAQWCADARASMPTRQGARRLKKMQQHRALQRAANENCALGIGPGDLKHSLRNIQADRGNLHGERPLSLWRSATTTLWHIDAGEQGPSTPSSSSTEARHRSPEHAAATSE